MICEECKKEEKKNILHIGLTTVTAMHFEPYYDEKGQYHYHNRNITTTYYKCSNGHEFTKNVSGSCWCGWSND